MKSPPNTRRDKLCTLLRETGSSYVSQTEGDSRDSRAESLRLRSEIDCLLHLYQEGIIDPVALFESSAKTVQPNDPAPLHG